MNEVMMVPVQEFNRLQDYKGQITQNASLNKAGHLAAEEHLILKDNRIPDSMAVKMVKPIAREDSKLVKRIWTGTLGPISYQGTSEPEGTADAPVENLLKQIIKGVKKEPKATAPVVIKQEAATPKPVKKEAASPKPKKKRVHPAKKIKFKPFTSGIKKETKTPKPPITPKPSTNKKGSVKKAVLSGAAKGFLRSVGIDERFIENEDDSGGYSPNSKKKKYKKAKKTEVEKLKEGWEDFEKPWRRRLGYDTD